MPENRPSPLGTRILSALILIPVALGAVYYGGIWLVMLLTALGVLMAFEWSKLVSLSRPALFVLIAAVTGGLAWGFMEGVSLKVIAVLVLVALAVVGLASRDRLLAGFGVLYIGVPLLAAWWLSGLEDGRVILFWVLGVVWVTDTGAYMAGRLIGGPKLAPVTSPNKTWAGLFGGVLAATVLAAVLAAWTGFAAPLYMAVISALLAALSQCGDLLESRIKRYYGVKDSGTIIPGHGGLFDRLDGLLAALPVVALLQILALSSGSGIFSWQ